MAKTYYLFYPMSIYLVTSRWKEKDNIMTACWATPLSDDPDMIGVAIYEENFSHELIRNSGYFAINGTCEELKDAAWYCGTHSGREEDKFEGAGLKKEDGKHVPLIADSPFSLECKVVSAVKAGDHTFFVGEVISKVKRFSARPLLHGGGKFVFQEWVPEKIRERLWKLA